MAGKDQNGSSNSVCGADNEGSDVDGDAPIVETSMDMYGPTGKKDSAGCIGVGCSCSVDRSDGNEEL